MMETTGRAVLFVALAISAGFAVYLISDFYAFHVLGVFMPLTMLTSSLTALTLLPALVLLSIFSIGPDAGTGWYAAPILGTIIAIAIPLVPYTARVIRSNTLALREQPFVEAARAVYTDAVVRQMLATVTFRQVPQQELLGLLPFKLTAMAGFEVRKVSPEGAVVADRTGEDPSKRAYAIITIGRGAPDQPADRARFARDLLTGTPLRDLKLTSGESMRINGSPGSEIRAEASGASGEPIKLVQWIRFGSATGFFLRIVAVAGKQDFDAVFNRFRALRGGVVYYDGQFDDARMNVALALTAIEHGAAAINYLEAVELLIDKLSKAKTNQDFLNAMSKGS